MKREIKFRGKSTTNNKWVYGDLRQENSGRILIITSLNTWRDNDDDIDPYGENIIVIPDTVGQFTGLHDKDGKEVYEGDVLQFPNGETVKVDYSESQCGFLGDIETLGFLVVDRTTVIGNIHDNPELLKGGL